MTRTVLSASLALFTSSMAFGQTKPESLPSFEVASVKVAEQPKPDAQGRMFIMRGCRGGPGTLTQPQLESSPPTNSSRSREPAPVLHKHRTDNCSIPTPQASLPDRKGVV